MMNQAISVRNGIPPAIHDANARIVAAAGKAGIQRGRPRTTDTGAAEAYSTAAGWV
jgi:hypothetical protein